MKSLKGENIYLRALEPDDLEFVYQVENNQDIWEVSNTQTPYSRFLIRQYLENAQQDIYKAQQLRLAICKNNSFEALGLIDLFDFDAKNKRAGIGIIINEKSNRNHGFGMQALGLLIDYSFEHLQLHQLFANISSNNSHSLKLFLNFGFQKIGTKKDWNFHLGKPTDEEMFQLINHKK